MAIYLFIINHYNSQSIRGSYSNSLLMREEPIKSRANKMTQERSLDDISLKLRKLWKGTLYISVIALYVLLLGSTFVFFGYKAALLSLFIIGVIQLFRYIASDVDRLGLIIETSEIEEISELSEEDQKAAHTSQEKNKNLTRQYQSKMYFLLVSLIQIANLVLVY